MHIISLFFGSKSHAFAKQFYFNLTVVHFDGTMHFHHISAATRGRKSIVVILLFDIIVLSDVTSVKSAAGVNCIHYYPLLNRCHFESTHK